REEFALDRLRGRLDEARADTLSAPLPTNGDGVDLVVDEHARTENSITFDRDEDPIRADTFFDRLGLDGEQRAVEYAHHGRQFCGPGGTDLHRYPPLISLSTRTDSASTVPSSGTGRPSTSTVASWRCNPTATSRSP